jgi:hypothetical protein
MALSVADHLADSDRIYDPEFQAELRRQGEISKQQFGGFISHPFDSSVTSIKNQWNTFQSLYQEGRGFEAGFGIGSYSSDVAGCVYFVRGTVQSALKVSMGGLRIATPVLTKGVNSTVGRLKEASLPISEFLAQNTLRSPITLQFDACRLNCGFPVDSIKLRKPLIAAPQKQHVKHLEQQIGASIFNEHLDYNAGSGGLHAYENFAKARETAKIRANLDVDCVPFLQKAGPYKNKIYTGMQSKDGTRGWRLDFDPNDSSKGVHINWWYTPDLTKLKKSYYGMITIESATENLYLELLSHFPQKTGL